MPMVDEGRLAELETRVAFQDEALEQLNDAVVALRGEVDRLGAEVVRLRERLAAVTPSPVGDLGNEPPPPHY